MAQDPKNFVPQTMVIQMPIKAIEESSAKRGAKAAVLCFEKALGEIQPETKNPDTVVNLYGDKHGFDNVLPGIRGELTARLLELLPS